MTLHFNMDGWTVVFKNFKYSLNGLDRKQYNDIEIKLTIERSSMYDYISFHTWL